MKRLLRPLFVLLLMLMLVLPSAGAPTAFANATAPTNGGNGGGSSGQCTGPRTDRPKGCHTSLVSSPTFDTIYAASKRQAKIAVCHWSEDDLQFVRIKVAAPAAAHHLDRHENDVLGEGIDCSALPLPAPAP